MNVFVLSTGRCGSLTFARACSHIENFSSAHESRVSYIGEKRTEYPSFHIESDNRLSWFLGRLDVKFGDSAFYVHLLRNPDAVAASYAERFGYRDCIMDAYSSGLLVRLSSTSRLEIARDYVRTVNTNIESFLKDKRSKMAFDIDGDVGAQFRSFWDEIGAVGNFSEAVREFSIAHNAKKDAFNWEADRRGA